MLVTKGQRVVGGNARPHGPVGMDESPGDYAEEVDKPLEFRFGQRELEDEHARVDENQRPRRERRPPARDGVSYGQHVGFLWRARLENAAGALHFFDSVWPIYQAFRGAVHLAGLGISRPCGA